MVVFPNCKINIGLHVLGKRADGYHNLETIFYPLPFYDVLEVIEGAKSNNFYDLTTTGVAVEGSVEDNLCVKAYKLLKKYFPQLPAVKIYLHKIIPVGAGLGGGSANGAFMLKLLNEKFNLQLTQQQLLQYALELGSDCPFFIINKPCFAQQRGEVLQPLQLTLSGYKLILINPGIHINTGQAFIRVEYSKQKSLQTIIEKPVKEWRDIITNDFELPVFEQHTEIQNIKNFMYAQNALYALMSGSGSTVYGIFRAAAVIDYSTLPAHYFIKEMIL